MQGISSEEGKGCYHWGLECHSHSKWRGWSLALRRYKEIYCRNWLTSYNKLGRWEILTSAFLREREQGSRWCNSVWVWRSKNQKYSVRGPKKMDIQAQISKFTLLLPFCCIQASKNGMMPTHTGEDILFPQSMIQMLIYSRNTHADTLRNGFPAFWASLSSVSWHLKLTIVKI